MASLPDPSDNAPWKLKVAEKREAEYAKIPKEWRLGPEFLTGNEHSAVSVMDVPAKSGILSPVELDITEKYNAVSLAHAVQSGSIKAVDVATAFCKRAAVAQQLLNCLTETMFDDAIKRGEYLDRYLVEHKKPLGLLHGVPISLKDHHNYVGVASTAGYVSFLDHPLPKTNSPLVETLLGLGAILYCKTNIPQTMMTADSHTNLFGRTLNPHKLTLTAGGSSGGEGALVAIRGSILGVGTDIGGSIRIPALCCGTYGFKPSSFRVPNAGVASPSRGGSPGFPSVAGPIANALEDCDLFLRAVIGSKPWNLDAGALPIPWRESVASTSNPKIKIGFYAGDPSYPIHPPVMRALSEAVKRLTNAGIMVIPLTNTPSLQPAKELCSDYWSLDNSKTFLKFISDSGEPMIPSLAKTIDLVNKKPSYTIDELFDINVARATYKGLWNRVWAEHELDVILCPGAQNTAVPHDTYGLPIYTCVWNLLEVSHISVYTIYELTD